MLFHKHDYRMEKSTHLEIRYANADMTQQKEMTCDLIFAWRSKTAMERIQATTRVIRAMTVILLMTAAQPRKKKQSRATTTTVMAYFSGLPLLAKVGMRSAAQMIPSSRHLAIKIKKASM